MAAGHCVGSGMGLRAAVSVMLVFPYSLLNAEMLAPTGGDANHHGNQCQESVFRFAEEGFISASATGDIYFSSTA